MGPNEAGRTGSAPTGVTDPAPAEATAPADTAAPAQPPNPHQVTRPRRAAGPVNPVKPVKKATSPARRTATAAQPAGAEETSVPDAAAIPPRDVGTAAPERAGTTLEQGGAVQGGIAPEQADAIESAAPPTESARAGATGRTTAKRTAPRKTAVKKAAAKRAAATETAPRKATPRKAAPGKTTPAKKTAPARKGTTGGAPPAAPTTLATPAAEPATALTVPVAMSITTAGDAPTTIDVRILDHPGYAPELLALTAVRVLGPEAEAWVRRARLDYPAATTHGLARLATRRFVRLAAAGSAAGAAAGFFAPFAALAALTWTQARLVLHLAAVFGEDPAAADRAAELLVLTRVHPDDASAREALRAARDATRQGEPPLHRVAEAAWRLATPLAARAPGWLALRYAARRMPGALLLAVTAAGTTDTERLAARAVTHYRARPTTGR